MTRTFKTVKNQPMYTLINRTCYFSYFESVEFFANESEMIRLFEERQSSRPYRIFIPHSREDVQNPCVLFWYKRHPLEEFGEGITFAQHKLSMIENAFVSTRMDHCIPNTPMHPNGIISLLPRDIWIYNIISFLHEKDILSFSESCRYARELCLDEIVWKMLCFRSFQDPKLFHVDFQRSCYNWRLKYLHGKSFKEKLAEHSWRLVFIVMFGLERTQSVIHPTDMHHTRRLSECLGSSFEQTAESSKGKLFVKGVPEVSCVEFVVYNYDIRAWHRKTFKNITPIEMDIVLSDLGLLASRSRHKLGPAKRQGYHLYTDTGERLCLINRIYPCATFRTFQYGGSYLLLCHNIVFDGAKYSDEFTLFRIKFSS